MSNENIQERGWWARYAAHYVKILRLGTPILVGQAGMIVVGFADNAMIGHYSTDALSAASFVNNVFNTAMMMCLGFTYGLTPLLGALFSTGRFDEIGVTLRRGLTLNTLYALLMTAVMTLLYFNVDRLGQPEHLLPLIRPYFIIYLFGLLPIVVFQVFAQCSYAINSSKIPMWIILGSNVVNIAGNALLIYGLCGLPEMGLTGAGLSTLVARVICPVAMFAVFLKHGRYRAVMRGFANAVKGESRRFIAKTSLPVSFQLGFETISFSAAAVMAGWLGALELASFQVILVIGMLGFCIYYGMGAAVSVLVANAKTDGGPAKMRRVAWAGFHIHIALAIVSSIVFALFGRQLISIFTDDPAVELLTLTLIPPLILYQLGDATQINFANALRGTANVVPMVWIALLAYIIIGIPATYTLAFPLNGGLPGIIYSYSVSLFAAASMFLYFFLRTLRKQSI